MSDAGNRDGCGGCLAVLAVVVVIALMVMAVISVAAILDPFSWLPTAAELWKDCADDFDTERDECAWANRFPGFWPKAIVNLVYISASAVAVVVLWASALEMRSGRIERYASVEAAARYEQSRAALLGMGACVATLAAPPLLVGIL